MPSLVERAKKAIIEYDKYLSKEDKPGHWGQAFDLLLMNDKIHVEPEVENAIIADLEAKLQSSTAADIPKIKKWDAEAPAIRLANYYRKKGKNDEVKRVLLTFGRALEEMTSESSAMQASGALEHVHKIYIKYGLVKEAEDILIELRTHGAMVDSEMVSIPFEYQFPKEKMDEYLKFMLEGDIKEVLHKIANEYITKKEEVKEQIFNLSKEAPTVYLFTKKIQDRKGRIVASIGSIRDDLEGNIIHQISRNLTITGIFLRQVIHAAIEQRNLNPEDIIDFLYQSPIFAADKKEIIQKGLEYYFADNHLISIHLLIPQIEDALRNIVEFAGGNVLKFKGGGFFLRTFDDILRDDIVMDAFGEDMNLYLRVLFTEQRGWNMRNNVCHGIIGMESFTHQSADRVLHALLCLGLLRKKEK